MNTRLITEDDLHGFIDQQLDPTRRAEVAAWLEAHPDEARRIAAYGAQRDDLRSALLPIGEEPVPPALNIRHLAAQRRPARAPWWLAAAAAVLFACLGGAAGWTLRGIAEPPHQGLALLGQEAADNYAVFAPDLVRPVELRSTAGSELAKWASHRLGRTVTIPDLDASGYRFMGGRVVATPNGPAALFMYNNEHGTRLVMLTRPMPRQQPAPMQPLARDGVSGFSWATQGMGYSLVGPTDAQTLHPIADAMRRQMNGDI